MTQRFQEHIGALETRKEACSAYLSVLIHEGLITFPKNHWNALVANKLRSANAAGMAM